MKPLLYKIMWTTSLSLGLVAPRYANTAPVTTYKKEVLQLCEINYRNSLYQEAQTWCELAANLDDNYKHYYTSIINRDEKTSKTESTTPNITDMSTLCQSYHRLHHITAAMPWCYKAGQQGDEISKKIYLNINPNSQFK